MALPVALPVTRPSTLRSALPGSASRSAYRPSAARPGVVGDRRPELVLIQGGRSVAARRRRRVFLVRRLVVATGALLLAGAGALSVEALTGAESPSAAATSTVVEVHAGDTLWGIAGRLDLGLDRREVVAALADENGSTVVTPGQHLRVPSSLIESAR